MTLNGNASAHTTSATSNRLTAVSNPARSFTHDAAGNTTVDNAAYTATYGLDNRLATLTRGGVTATYTYDNAGQRVRKVVGGTTTHFVHDQDGRLLGEFDAAGNALREYVWLGDIPVAVFTPGATASDPPIVYYIHADHLNTPRVVVDRNNAMRWRWLSEPFGTAAAEENPAGLGAFEMPLRFPGQYYDRESGLAYNHHRYFDPTTGRYVTADPLGLDGGDLSLYQYAHASPTKYIDPDGRFAFLAPLVPWIIGGSATGGWGWGTAAVGTGVILAVAATPGDTPSADARQRQAEYEAYKSRCTEPPPPGLDPCALAKWKRDRNKSCRDMRQNWDDRWQPGRHAQAIAELTRAIEKLDDWITRNCPQQCP